MGNKYIQEVGDILSKKSRSTSIVNEVNNDNINVNEEIAKEEKKQVINENKSVFQKIYDKKSK